jgi:hypothetical protein
MLEPVPQLSPADFATLTRAFVILGRLGGNVKDSEFRAAWEAMREVTQVMVGFSRDAHDV